HAMLLQGTPNDYVVATGESYSVREFVETAARALGIAIFWSGHGADEVGRDAAGRVIVKIDKRFFRPAEVHSLRGNYTKARKELGWKPQTTFEEMVEMMVRSDFDRLSFSQKRPW